VLDELELDGLDSVVPELSVFTDGELLAIVLSELKSENVFQPKIINPNRVANKIIVTTLVASGWLCALVLIELVNKNIYIPLKTAIIRIIIQKNIVNIIINITLLLLLCQLLI
jgi:hypothetical protein